MLDRAEDDTEIRVTAGVHSNLGAHSHSIEANVQGAALIGLPTCLPDTAIPLKVGVVEQSYFGDLVVPCITDMPQIAVHIVPSAEPPTGMGGWSCRRWRRVSPMLLPA